MDKDFVTIELSVLFRGFVRRKAMLRKLKNTNRINFQYDFSRNLNQALQGKHSTTKRTNFEIIANFPAKTENKYIEAKGMTITKHLEIRNNK